MKSKKMDLWVFFYTLAVLILAGWLTVTARTATKQAEQIETLTERNQELREDLEELRGEQEELRRQAAADRAEIQGAVQRLESLEASEAETRGHVSNIFYTLRKWARKKAQEEKEAAEAKQRAGEANQTATWSSSEATRASYEDAGAAEWNPDPVPDSPAGMRYIGDYILTAYEWTGNPCANGNYPTEGFTIASNTLPIGTRVYIEGIGERVVEDTGGMSGDVIDIYMGDVSECYQFGRQAGAVYILD